MTNDKALERIREYVRRKHLSQADIENTLEHISDVIKLWQQEADND